jgi:membrane-bound ClpP family serine protease
MFPACPGFARTTLSYRPRGGGGALFVFLILLGTPSIDAQVPAPGKDEAAEDPVDGLFVTVLNPIDSKVVERVKTATQRFLDRPDHRGLKIVFDFNPDGQPSSTPNYGPCHDLAEFLLDVQDVTTIAFVHNDVTGHAVLPVLACKEIVMSDKARLGDALRDQPRSLEPPKDQVVFYEEVARRRGRYPAIVLKMLDRNLEVLKGRMPNGDLGYIDKRRLADEVKLGFLAKSPEPILKAELKPKLFTAAEAEEFGLRERLEKVETRKEVQEAYRLPASSLREDPLEGRTPNAWRVVVAGRVSKRLQETLDRRIRRAIHRGANIIVLQLQCGGGDVDVARDLGNFFRNLKDDAGEAPVKTIAYVTKEARNTAAFLAFGCTDIIMEKDARLGDFKTIVDEHPTWQKSIADSLADLAEKQGYPPVLARAMLDPKGVVCRVQSKKGKFQPRKLMTGDDWDEDQRTERRWTQEEVIKPQGQWFNLEAGKARDLGVARFVYDGEPKGFASWMKTQYSLETLKEADGDWLDEVADFLCNPVVSIFLVMIGITGLILELKIPGVGLPGVLAALCFVLYFWAHFDPVRGQLTFLAILLFFLGLVLIGLEIFVVPGFGVTGISGVVLMIVSLALVTLVKKPETTQEWLDFGTTLTTLGLGMVGAVVSALILAWYLPHIPWANRLVLAAPKLDQSEALEEEVSHSASSAQALLGTIGQAATDLRPAGMARFGDAYVDVVAEGSFVQTGARVQVIEIEGNRIVVKAV